MILKYANLFDLDQLLISTEQNSIEETRVSEGLRAARSNYQRSLTSINEEQSLSNNRTPTTDENDSSSMIINEKRTSAGNLVQQLICKYYL